MSPLAAILSLLTGVAGWYYLFFSKGAAGLSDVEDERLNRRRVALRRAGGGVMVALAVGLYVGFYAADDRVRPGLFVGVWSAVMILMLVLVGLALADVRLTARLRRHRLGRQREKPVDPTRPS